MPRKRLGLAARSASKDGLDVAAEQHVGVADDGRRRTGLPVDAARTRCRDALHELDLAHGLHLIGTGGRDTWSAPRRRRC